MKSWCMISTELKDITSVHVPLGPAPNPNSKRTLFRNMKIHVGLISANLTRSVLLWWMYDHNWLNQNIRHWKRGKSADQLLRDAM